MTTQNLPVPRAPGTVAVPEPPTTPPPPTRRVDLLAWLIGAILIGLLAVAFLGATTPLR